MLCKWGSVWIQCIWKQAELWTSNILWMANMLVHRNKSDKEIAACVSIELTATGEIYCKLLFRLKHGNIYKDIIFRLSMGLLPDTQNCGCACAGNAGNVYPVTAGKRSRHASRHVRHARAVMHAGIANYRFLLKSAAGENVPGIPGACATCNFAYLVRGPFVYRHKASCNGCRTPHHTLRLSNSIKRTSMSVLLYHNQMKWANCLATQI